MKSRVQHNKQFKKRSPIEKVRAVLVQWQIVNNSKSYKIVIKCKNCVFFKDTSYIYKNDLNSNSKPRNSLEPRKEEKRMDFSGKSWGFLRIEDFLRSKA